MKYGNIHQKGMNIEEERAALNEAVEKGLISEEQAKSDFETLMRRHLIWIVATNGGYIPKTKGKRLKATPKPKTLLEEVEEAQEQAKNEIEVIKPFANEVSTLT